MASLYGLSYVGRTGGGMGAMYLGNGTIAGFDVYGGRYKGTYTEGGGRLKATVTLSMPGGGELVTGKKMPAGSSLQVSADWPQDFSNAGPLTVMVAGQPVQVTLQKMVDF